MTQSTDSMDSLGPANSAKTADNTPPENPKYMTRETESPPLVFGPKRVHYAYSVSLPLIHLTFVSIVQGFVLALLLQSFPLPSAASVASVANFVTFVGVQHVYLPYVISGLLVILIWKQFVQASIILIWPLSTLQIALMLLISLMEVIAFREITHFSAWLAGLGLVAIVGGFIRLNNIRVSPRSYFAAESLRRTEDAAEWRSGILYILLGILVGVGAMIVHTLFDGAAVPLVANVEWLVLGILSCLMVVVILLDRYDLLVALRDGAQNSDLIVDHFGGVSYDGENDKDKDTQSR